MEQLGYQPVPFAKRASRGKRNGKLKHNAVGILFLGGKSLQWITNCAPIYAYALNGIESALNSRGINCVIRTIANLKDVEAIARQGVDGLLLLGDPQWDKWPEGISNIPAVKIFSPGGSDWYDSITYNSDTVGRLGAEYLFSRGIRHAAVIGSSTGIFARRIFSFLHRIKELGGVAENLTDADAIRVKPGVNSANRGVIEALADKFARWAPGCPRGVFVTSDVLTPCVYRALHHHGVAIGKDAAVVTCNNEKPYLLSLYPRPAVVDIQAEAIGQQAVERLLWRIDHPGAPRVTLMLEPELLPSPTGPLFSE
jgi:LacI family transcriptional regulator